MIPLRLHVIELRKECAELLADRDRAEANLCRLLKLCDRPTIRHRYGQLSKLVDSLLGRTEPLSELEEQAAEIAELRETIAKLSK